MFAFLLTFSFAKIFFAKICKKSRQTPIDWLVGGQTGGLLSNDKIKQNASTKVLVIQREIHSVRVRAFM